ncbi:MAG: ferrous iron transport protein B [Oscillospiraceae bacterium]|nr:ferrous iron transport protein B [Oscillospiraceae bacterium]
MEHYTVALAGNPNVGKSTLFNALTGLHQHTGNWPGKTVERAEGGYSYGGAAFTLIDLPGTYSLSADSPEEEIARDFLQRGADVTVVVTDAGALRRNLHLALQVRQLTDRVVLCVNLMDEAAKKGVEVDLERLSRELSVPVIGAAARSGVGLSALKNAVLEMARRPQQPDHWQLRYDAAVERALSRLAPYVPRHQALALLMGEVQPPQEAWDALNRARVILDEAGLVGQCLRESITASQVRRAEQIGSACTHSTQPQPHRFDRALDRILTSRAAGLPIMLLGLGVIFYLTVRGANYPSQLLSRWLMALQQPLRTVLAGAPLWLQGLLVDGVYRTVAWVVAVMLPPMAIFFPLFTLLEDVGYLPRVAFNLDRFFRSAGAHGRQSLTMCMALGCSACGVTGCRIIDSPRERLIAILTNCFLPCNGRFPTLIALVTVFIVPSGGYLGAAAVFVALIVFAVGMTWLASKLLSVTLLKGESSSFSLELPPYRRPQIGKVLVRSLLDRTLFVLLRAVKVAAPAGALIWVLANLSIGGETVLSWAASALDAPAALLGVDGMILLAFLLGFPANEIVLPVLLMGYLSAGALVEYDSLLQLGAVLRDHGWTALTAVCTMVLCLLHFPCGTTCLTIKKETGSLKWTAVAVLLPTVLGAVVCLLIHGAAVLFGL